MAAIIDGSTYKGFWELTGGLLYGSVTGSNEITLINWTDSGLPNDEVNNIGILIV